jgi:hypothetical protein
VDDLLSFFWTEYPTKPKTILGIRKIAYKKNSTAATAYKIAAVS